jgi:hypothetical protein
MKDDRKILIDRKIAYTDIINFLFSIDWLYPLFLALFQLGVCQRSVRGGGISQADGGS